jgi:hypothetical protein
MNYSEEDRRLAEECHNEMVDAMYYDRLSDTEMKRIILETVIQKKNKEIEKEKDRTIAIARKDHIALHRCERLEELLARAIARDEDFTTLNSFEILLQDTLDYGKRLEQARELVRGIE